MVKIYFSDYSKRLSDADFFNYLQLLPAELREKTMRFQKWQDQHASLYGKLLLIKILETSGLTANLHDLKYTNHGRPYLDNTPDFNIAHSGSRVVCALTMQGKIGVDIEEIKPTNFEDFKEEFSAAEWNTIVNAKNQDYWFYYYWTAKEATIKADGRGLNLALKYININNNKIKTEQGCWFIKQICIDKNYMLQLATNIKISTKVELHNVLF